MYGWLAICYIACILMRVDFLRPGLVCALLCLPFIASAQTAAPKAGSNPAVTDPYAAEPLVIVRLETVTDMHADGTGSTTRTVVARVQSEATLKQFSVISVPFASGSQKVEFLYARVRHADGTVTETPPSDVMEQPEAVTREAPFYSDLKDAQLPIKGLRVGDTLEWQSRATMFKAEAPGEFWGQEGFISDGITLEESYELRVPGSMQVHVWSNPRAGAAFTDTTAGDTRVYKWTHSNLKPTVGAAAEAAKAAEKKHVLTAAEQQDARDGKLPDIAWTTFADWQAVGAWYRGLEADRVQPSAAVKAKVADLTAGKTTEEDKVRAVYGYVSTQIHYIGVAFGIGRYQPHTADEVLSSQYGDCKDKHTLLASMLTALGLQPDAVLIGAGVRFNEAVPAPQSFNHLITRVQVDGKEVWLDSTAEVAPYRMLTAVLRDKPALVIPAAGPAKIERTPAEPPFALFEDMTAKGKLDKDGISDSRITLTYRGDEELFLREVVRQITPAQYDELSQRLANSMGYAGTTSHTEVSRPDDTSQPFTISFDYHREKGGDWDNHRILPQLAPVDLPVVDPKDPPLQDLDLRAPRTEQSHAEMQLPAGWGAELPEAVHASSPYATYDLTFHLDKGLLIADRKVTVLKQYAPVAEWKQYKQWQDAVSLGNETFVQLTNFTSSAEKSPEVSKDSGSGSGAGSGGKADELIDQARRELNQHQLEGAQADLDRVKATNANERGLWACYGYLDFLRGDSEGAVRDYHKEIALHPDEFWSYRALAEMQISIDQRPGAEETLRGWMAADASDPTPVAMLVNLLLDDQKPKDALAAAQSGIGHLPPDKKTDENVQLALGRAQMKAGAVSEGDATLTALLKDSKGPLTLNNAAYELADANRELALADASEKSALAKLDAETATWTMDESPQTLAQSSTLLSASWDTMGWILFREGKTAEAEAYLRAARRSRRDWTVSEHLADVELARGDKSAALAQYQDALAVVPKVNTMGVRKAPGPEAIEIQGKIDALKRAGVRASPLVDPNSQAGRTFSLGPSKGRSGAAEYKLLLSREKVERIEPVAGETEIRDVDGLLQNFKTQGFFPPDSGARLIEDVFVNCHQAVCELVLRH